jgi:hypothetical protein
VAEDEDEVAADAGQSASAMAAAWPFPTGPAHAVAPQPGLTSAQVQAQPQPQGVLYTKEQAAQILGIGLDALRKRLDRGVSVVRVNINGQDLVRFV